LSVAVPMLLILALAQTASAVLATGGNVTNDIPGYRIHIYTNSATASNFVVTAGRFVEVLVVAGGGGGGHDVGGGGGAGGLIYSNFLPVVASKYTVVVGAGGIGAGSGPAQVTGQNGSNSTFGALVAIGGGGGGNCSAGNGANGGSGGGASGYSSPGNPGTGTSGQGNNGGANGSGSVNLSGSGGGGARVLGAPRRITALIGRPLRPAASVLPIPSAAHR